MSENKGGESEKQNPNASKPGEPGEPDVKPAAVGKKPADDKNKKDQEAKPVDAPTARRRQDAIGRRLRQMYEDVVSEPVPDDFLGFLQKADTRGTPSGDGPKPPGKGDKSTSGK